MGQLFMVRDDLEGIPAAQLPEGCQRTRFSPARRPRGTGYWRARSDAISTLTPRWLKRVLFARADTNRSAVLPAERDRVGVARPEPGRAYRRAALGGDPSDCGGQRLGRAVIAAALNKLRELGYTRAMLITDDFRLPAIKLYKEFGFRPVYDAAERYDPECRPQSEDEAAQAARRAEWAEVERGLQGLKSIKPERIWLWPDGAPMFNPEYGQEQPSLTAFPVEGSKGAVVVCPGGGYVMKASHAPIARMLNQAGISAYVLDYRVAPYVMPAPILDANRAIRVVRSMGYERVGILGFSAGGHLTGMAGTMYDAGDPDSPDPIERLSSRPDAFVPCYAVVSLAAFTHFGSRLNIMGEDANNWKALRAMSAELRVTEDTPPCFMWHTAEDNAVPVENSLNLAEACVKNGVPVELHIFPKGAHGLGLAGGTHAGQWTRLCQNWLLSLGFGK